MKTEKELMKAALIRDDWKSLKLWSWAHDYESKAEEWNNIFPPVTDDRRIFINTYYQVYNAIDSLTDNPNTWVCCAISHELDSERKTMDEIIDKFTEREKFPPQRSGRNVRER